MMNFLRKPTRKTVIIGVAIALVILFGSRVFQSQSSENNSERMPKVSLISAIEYQNEDGGIQAIGEVESLDQVNLRSEISSTVQSVNYKIGDVVRPGDTLVTLDHSTLNAQLSQAAASIQRAQGAYDQLIAGATPESVQQAAAALAQAQSQRDQSVLDAELAVTNAKIALDTAQANLNNTSASTNQGVNSAYQNAVNTASQASQGIVNALITVTDIQDSYIEFINQDTVSLQISEKKAQTIFTFYNGVNGAFWSRERIAQDKGGLRGRVEAIVAASSSDRSQLLTILNDLDTVLKMTRDLLNLTQQGVNKSQSVSDADKATVSTAQGTNDGHISSITAAIQSIENAEINQGSSGDTTRLAYERALADYDAAIKRKDEIIASANALVQVQQAAYDAVVAGPRSVDQSTFIAGLREAQASYQLVAANRAKAFITAPVGGVVARVDVRVGDQVNPGAAIVSVVNTAGLQVKAYISHKDRAFISEGAEVLIEGTYKGVVTRIAPSITPSTNKVEIIISVVDEDSSLTVGQFASVSIELNNDVEQSFFVPLRAVAVTPSHSAVYSVENGVVVEKKVTTGKVVGSEIEILSGIEITEMFIESARGLQPGDRVEIHNAQ